MLSISCWMRPTSILSLHVRHIQICVHPESKSFSFSIAKNTGNLWVTLPSAIIHYKTKKKEKSLKNRITFFICHYQSATWETRKIYFFLVHWFLQSIPMNSLCLYYLLFIPKISKTLQLPASLTLNYQKANHVLDNQFH